MKAYFCIFVLVIIFTVSCNCTPSKDTIVIEGLEISGPSSFSKFIPVLQIRFSTKDFIKEGKKQNCLSYNKEKALETIENAVIPESFLLTCNRSLDTFTANQDIPLPKVNTNGGRVRDENILMETENMVIDSVYIFTVSCKTIDGKWLTATKSVKILP